MDKRVALKELSEKIDHFADDTSKAFTQHSPSPVSEGSLSILTSEIRGIFSTIKNILEKM